MKVNSPDGTIISYDRSGAGPPLVLVPGAGAANPAAWPVFPALAEKFTVYAVDRRGHGKSGDSASYAIEREYEDIAAVVDSIGEPVHLMGHSFGACCALEAALLTRNIRKLVLYEPLSISSPGKPLYPEGLLDQLQKLVDMDDRETALNLFYRSIAELSPDEVELLKSSPVWAERLAIVHTIPRELRADERYSFDARRFMGLHTPTLLLEGGNSRDFEKTGNQVAAAALPNSRIAVLPGQQHIAMYTAPELFVEVVVTFLLDQR